MSELASVANFRDFGGYRTEDGRRVRRGRLFRSGLLCDLDADDQARLQGFDLRLVCDLRSEEECIATPTPPLECEPRHIHLPIEPGKRLAELPLDAEGVTPEQRANRLETIYVEFAEDHAHVYAEYFEELLGLERGASLVHCTAGKDRTGFAAAVLLRCLGVPHSTVMKDYLRTNETLDFGRFIAPRLQQYYNLDFTPEYAREVSQARETFLNAAFDALEQAWGSFEAYLERGLGVTHAHRERLAHLFLEAS